MANYLSVEKRKQIFHLLCEGNGLRAITRIVGCSTCAVSELQRRYCSIIEFINRVRIKNLEIEEIEADELRVFVMRKNNIRWVYVALDRKSRLVIHFHIGKRDTNDARIFLTGLSDKLAESAKVSTDCLKSYVSAVEKTPNGFNESDTDSIELMRARYMGKNALKRSITNRIEAHNGNIRQHVSRLTRRTRCFSKKEEGLRQHLTLFFFYYNYMKIHKSTKAAPAVTAGIISRAFTFDELMEFDKMFSGAVSNKIPAAYGIVELTEKHLMSPLEFRLFMNSLEDVPGTKTKTTSGWRKAAS